MVPQKVVNDFKMQLKIKKMKKKIMLDGLSKNFMNMINDQEKKNTTKKFMITGMMNALQKKVNEKKNQLFEIEKI